MAALRERVHNILDVANPDDRSSRAVDLALIGLIFLNVAAIILESIDSLSTQYASLFRGFETASIIVFTIEYLLRVWSCPDHPSGRFRGAIAGRLAYMKTPMALIDLIAILPFYLSMFVNVDLRFLRGVRVLRVLKLSRYSSAISVLTSVVREEGPAFGAAFFILFVVLVLASSGIYAFEREAQPEAFGSIPAAMWWAVATLTTVGYGDVTPITPLGKVFGACISIIGIGMVALPTGILASGFNQELRTRRQCYQKLVDEVLEDGVVSNDEREAMERTRLRLGLSEEDSAHLLRSRKRQLQHTAATCSHCGHPINGSDSDAR